MHFDTDARVQCVMITPNLHLTLRATRYPELSTFISELMGYQQLTFSSASTTLLLP